MSKNTTVKILSVDNPSQLFGKTDYTIFQAETSTGDMIAVGVSHNALSRKGIDANNIVTLDSLAGSSLVILSAPVDIRDAKGPQFSGEERVSHIVDGVEINGRVRTLLLCSAADCSIIKSESCTNELRETAVQVSAQVQVVREKEKRLSAAAVALQRAIERRLLAGSTASTVTSSVVEDEPAF